MAKMKIMLKEFLEFSRRNATLTIVGEQQAHLLAEKIKELGLKFNVIYSSPLKRTLKTAKIISQVSGMPKPIISEALIERDFGIMTGKPISSIKELCSPNIIQAEMITYFLIQKGPKLFPI